MHIIASMLFFIQNNSELLLDFSTVRVWDAGC